MSDELPKLPEPVSVIDGVKREFWQRDYYTAEQMHEYALAARSHRPAGSEVDERAAFESWADDQGFDLKRLDVGDSEGYLDLRTQGAWDAWQERASRADRASAAPTGQQAATAEEMRPHFEWWYTTRGIFPPLGSDVCAAAWAAWMASGGYTAPADWTASPIETWGWKGAAPTEGVEPAKPIGEVVDIRKVGWAEIPTVHWETFPLVGTKLYAAPTRPAAPDAVEALSDEAMRAAYAEHSERPWTRDEDGTRFKNGWNAARSVLLQIDGEKG